MNRKVKAEKFCGNCSSHNLYEHPNLIFCSTRYDQHKDPIVDTLWCCGEWSMASQECYCVRDALERKNSRARQR